MPTIAIKEGEFFDVGLRRFKRACEKAGIISKLRSIEYYEKPTWKRKRKGIAAAKRWLKKVARDRDGFRSTAEERKRAMFAAHKQKRQIQSRPNISALIHQHTAGG